MVLTVGFVDGFDHYPTTVAPGTTLGILQSWQTSGSGSGPTPDVSQTGYRARGKRLELTPGLTGDARFIRTVPASSLVSMHIASSVAHFDTSSTRGWISFRNNTNQEVFAINTLPTAQLALCKGATILATTQPISTNVAHRYNIAANITSPTHCAIQMWVDGDPAKGFNMPDVNAVNNSGPIEIFSLEQWGYGAGADGGNDHGFDDLVYCYGAAQNIGELEVLTGPPINDVRQQWTRSTGAANYANVDDIPPNADTDYNSSAAVGNIDLQGFGALPTSPDSIFCLSQIFGIRKEESGTRAFAPVMKGTGVDQIGATQNVATSYDWFYQHYLTNPDTAAAWLASERLAASYGYKDAI